jgi:hypothetical protein
MNTIPRSKDEDDERYDDDGRLVITRRRTLLLAAVSTLWLFAEGQPFLPLGLLYAAWWLGSQADHTFLRGLRRGWRALAVCVIAATVGVWLGPSVGVSHGGHISVGLHVGR